jgi:polar amino acid transport system substrate-binding protein
MPMRLLDARPVRIAAFAMVVVVVLAAGAYLAVRPEPAADPALAGRVPARIRADGVLTVGIDPSWAPAEFRTEGSDDPTGFETDLVLAAAGLLGLRVRWRPTTFDDVTAGVQDRRFELGAAALPVTDAMLSRVIMVSYFRSGTQWAAGAATAPLTPDSACGRRLAVLTGTVQTDDADARSAACVDAGRAAITVHRYPSVQALTAAVTGGTDDAFLVDSAVAAYAVQTSSGRLRAVGDPYDLVPVGVAVNAADRDLADAVEAAFTALIANGTYSRILTRWHQAAGALPHPDTRP